MPTRIKAGTATSGGVFEPDTAGTLELQTGSTPTTAIAIDTSQNVGIGINSPVTRLHIQSSASNTRAKIVSELSGSVYNSGIEFARTTVSGGALIDTARNASVGGVGLAFSTTADNTAEVNGTYTERMRITSAGDVGIGTSSPAYKLDIVSSAVDGGMQITGGASGANLFLNNNGTNGRKYRVYSTGSSNAVGAGFLGFFDETAGNFRMGIDSSGVLQVGGLTTFSDAAIIAYANGRGWAGKFQRPNNGNMVEFLNNTSTAGTITVSGTTTSYNSGSDYRLKENIKPMLGALDKVSLMKPVTWIWKTDGSAGQGFVAHELQEIVPDAVSGEKDAVDEEGNPVYQGVDTSFLVATLTAAIQELKAELGTVKSELATLKGVA